MDQAFRLYLLVMYSDKYVISKIFVVSSVIFDHDHNDCVDNGQLESHFYTVTKDKEIVLRIETLNRYIFLFV